ncbi:hypothetical protein JYU34_006894 [Plutella xylostella]|uniref:Uncharacterized protein n=1 Tax=Plutella xylostella TaxID=51655 RepID=A0ABQ7QT34_PLUXY|nr:hypothetical protein JYU34_006894 [Plutella xylostella]
MEVEVKLELTLDKSREFKACNGRGRRRGGGGRVQLWKLYASKIPSRLSARSNKGEPSLQGRATDKLILSKLSQRSLGDLRASPLCALEMNKLHRAGVAAPAPRTPPPAQPSIPLCSDEHSS